VAKHTHRQGIDPAAQLRGGQLDDGGLWAGTLSETDLFQISQLGHLERLRFELQPCKLRCKQGILEQGRAVARGLRGSVCAYSADVSQELRRVAGTAALVFQQKLCNRPTLALFADAVALLHAYIIEEDFVDFMIARKRADGTHTYTRLPHVDQKERD